MPRVAAAKTSRAFLSNGRKRKEIPNFMAEVRRIHKIREAIPAKEGGSGEYPSIARTGEGKRRKRQKKART